MLNTSYSWGMRRAFSEVFSLTTKRLSGQKRLTVAELRHLTDAISHSWDRNVSVGKPEAFGSGLEGEWFTPDGWRDLPHCFQLFDAFTAPGQARKQLRQFVDRHLTQ